MLSVAACWRTACTDAKLGRLRVHHLRQIALGQAVSAREDLLLVGYAIQESKRWHDLGLLPPCCCALSRGSGEGFGGVNEVPLREELNLSAQ